MLLLITGASDGTADRLVLGYGEGVFRFNYDLWHQYSVLYTPEGWSIENPAGLKITDQTASACFWWKPLQYYPGNVDRAIKEEVKYFLRDIYGWFRVRGLAKGNSPNFHSEMGKVNILSVAKKYFPIPRSAYSVGLIGLDEFSDKLIVKSLASAQSDDKTVLMTTSVPSIEALDPKFPWFIQDEIESSWDVTVFLCGRGLFAFKRSRADIDGVDWRTEQDFSQATQEWFPFDLSEENSKHLLSLASELGVDFGRFDFMSDRKSLESLFFLELNAAGQWVFLDIADRYGLVDAVVSWLKAEGVGSDSSTSNQT